MMQSWKNRKQRLMPLLLIVLLTGCGLNSQTSGVNSQTVKPASFPQMPPAGRQPQKPQICLPTCTKNLTAARANSLNTLTQQQAPGQSAKGHTTQ
ncbi:hypothetical protein WP4W18E05_23180 [Klebsiella sp. WP4-W18-ESBL-05]|nr:hypothetical protein WP4W18E05_23180 [Klebsiella sp. WP4-W18-ESBL-05]